MREVKLALVLLAVALVAGCPSSSGSGGGAGSGADAAKFSEIYPMIFPANTAAKCNFCHSMPPTNVSNGKLSMGMDKAAAYAALVGQKSVSMKCGGMDLVVPGQPDASLLIKKISENPPPCGNRMPLGAAQLSDEEIAMIRSWIAAGAKDD